MLPRLDNSPFQRLDLALLLGTCRSNTEPVKRPSVRRNLFGTPSQEKQESDFLTQESHLADEEARRRFRDTWGFDTLTGIPVENHKYEWIRLERKDDIPHFYRKPYAPSKSKPVHGPRRERSHNTPYPPRLSKRGYPRTSENENNDYTTDVHILDEKVTIVADRQSMLTTPKAPRLDSPSSSPNHVEPPSSGGDSCSSCSNSSLGFKSDGRSRSVSNKSSSSGSINVSTGSSKQLTIKDLFQVKKSSNFNSLQRK